MVITTRSPSHTTGLSISTVTVEVTVAASKREKPGNGVDN